MKRLARFVLYALAPISFLLLSATVILWVRTYFASDRISFYAPYKSDPDRWKAVLAGFKAG